MKRANPKVNGYAHPNTNPDSRKNDRRRRARIVIENCRATHPQVDGRCAR